MDDNLHGVNVQIIEGKLRYITNQPGDLTAVPPGSEFISRATIEAACAALGITEEQLAQALIAGRGLVDERNVA